MPEFISVVYAKRVVASFVRRLGNPYAFIVYEQGAAGERNHIHGLIGRLPQESIATGHKLWEAGIVQKWEKYDPLRGGCWYVAKATQYGEFEFFGTPKRLRRRVRQKLIKRRAKQRAKTSSSSLRRLMDSSQNC